MKFKVGDQVKYLHSVSAYHSGSIVHGTIKNIMPSILGGFPMYEILVENIEGVPLSIKVGECVYIYEDHLAPDAPKPTETESTTKPTKMKAQVITKAPTFTPVTIEITFDSQSSLDAFGTLFNVRMIEDSLFDAGYKDFDVDCLWDAAEKAGADIDKTEALMRALKKQSEKIL